MGEAKRRKDKLGRLYGTPEGSNRPKEVIWPRLDEEAQMILKLQAVADAEERPLACWLSEVSDQTVDLRVSPNAPDPEPEGIRWIPPTKPQAALAYRHPVCVQRSGLTGKWAVVLHASAGPHLLDVFHDVAKALASAQNAQVVFGTADATADADGATWHRLIQRYAAEDAASGLESDDEVLSVAEPGENGFRVLRGTGAVPDDRLPSLVDSFRQMGLHVRLPD